MKMYEPMEAEIRKFFKIGVENFIEKLTNDAAEELMSIDEQLENGNIKEELIEDCVIEIEPLEESIKIDEDPRLLKERSDIERKKCVLYNFSSFKIGNPIYNAQNLNIYVCAF